MADDAAVAAPAVAADAGVPTTTADDTPPPPLEGENDAADGGEDAAAAAGAGVVTVNIKTLNGPDFELAVRRDELVSELKTKVRQQTNVDEVGGVIDDNDSDAIEVFGMVSPKLKIPKRKHDTPTLLHVSPIWFTSSSEFVIRCLFSAGLRARGESVQAMILYQVLWERYVFWVQRRLQPNHRPALFIAAATFIRTNYGLWHDSVPFLLTTVVNGVGIMSWSGGEKLLLQ